MSVKLVANDHGHAHTRANNENLRRGIPLRTSRIIAAGSAAIVLAASSIAAASEKERLEERLRAVEPRVIEWRRDIHRNPELSNREFRTAKLVTEHLKRLGLEVQSGIAHTGVVAFLRGGKPGPTIALRADMDALPVTEEVDVPFRSRATAEYRGETVGVMHACGHDAHTAILMGVAEVLAGMRDSLAGNVLFIFQPAEEGPPAGEEGGAELMLKEGLFEKYRPEAVFGLHVWSLLRAGEIGYRSGPTMAASDFFTIRVRGRQSHGSRPWQGIDPIVTAAQIVNALQTIVSRQVDITRNPAVVTVGAIKGGIRHNIIPDELEMIGTIRTFEPEQRAAIIQGMERIVRSTAEANGASATFHVDPSGNPVVVNDPDLTRRMLPTLQRVAGAENVKELALITGAEDFAFYAREVPGLFFFVGVTPRDQDPETAAPNHSPRFFIDESAIGLGLRAMTELTLDYLAAAGG
ncbi:MAG: amidohydrolase [Pseudomonadota bacterium]